MVEVSLPENETKYFNFILLPMPVKLAEHHLACANYCGPIFYPPNHDTQQKTDHNTENYVPYS